MVTPLLLLYEHGASSASAGKILWGHEWEFPMSIRTIFALFAGLLLFHASPVLSAHGQITGTIVADTLQQSNEPQNKQSREKRAAELMESDDFEAAFSIYFSLCADNDAPACLQAASMLESGDLTDTAPYGEIALIERACDLGDDIACDAVRDKSTQTQTSCGQENAEACVANAFLRLTNFTEVTYAPKIAASNFQRACELGHKAACTELANLLARGVGTARDHVRADTYYDLGCAETHPTGCGSAAAYHRTGRFAPVSLERTAAYFDRGCAFGDLYSCRELGYAYLNGDLVRTDLDRARDLLQHVCESGDRTVCKDVPSAQ